MARVAAAELGEGGVDCATALHISLNCSGLGYILLVQSLYYTLVVSIVNIYLLYCILLVLVLVYILYNKIINKYKIEM